MINQFNCYKQRKINYKIKKLIQWRLWMDLIKDILFDKL